MAGTFTTISIYAASTDIRSSLGFEMESAAFDPPQPRVDRGISEHEFAPG
jgi:hypothetical protein